MPARTQSRDVKNALRSLEVAHDYLVTLTKGAEIPITPKDLHKAVDEFHEILVSNQAAANALVVAVLGDEPCPVSLFKPWASYGQIRLWSKRTDGDRLVTEILNGKTCVRPSAFFVALKTLGKAA